MLYFECDYNNGCHEKILEALKATNSDFTPGYGEDKFTESAKNKIKQACKCPNADVFLLGGGTQTNETVIASLLQDYEGAVAAVTGHIGGHESGAVEYTGHKVLTIPQHQGKIDAGELDDYFETYYNDANHEHMVWPGLVYISFPTEYGTIYSKQELTDIYSVCQKRNVPLFIDGARLGYGLMSTLCDISLPELASLCDVFYIGGTKVGALCGEAVVFPHANAPKHFVSTIKQHGAMFAKGRLNGVQFDTLFTDNLYFEISKNAIEKAELLKDVLRKKGYKFFLETCTNQQFVIIENSKMASLAENVRYGFWEKYDDKHTVIRFCTSWCTTEEDIRTLEKYL